MTSETPICFILAGNIEKIEGDLIYIKPVVPVEDLKNILPFKVVNDSFVIKSGLPICIPKFFKELEELAEFFIVDNKVIRIG
jgi:hypothetical protein